MADFSVGAHRALSNPIPLPSRLVRSAIEDQIEALIAVLDMLDGDPDHEDDDPAGQSDEDGINTGARTFWAHGVSHIGPGCPISEPGELNRQNAASLNP